MRAAYTYNAVMGHGLIWWIVVGLVAGILAKVLMPGSNKEPSGCIMTIILGVVGSVLMGFIMEFAGFRGQGGMLATIGGATLGACILLFLFRKFSR